MSHQTGIRASDELRNFFAISKDGRIRLIKISIVNEQLTLDTSEETRGTWEDDWDQLMQPLLDDEQPCYIIYRSDTRNSTGFEWIYISFSPDHAPVRQKMLYAATRATLKVEFGGGQIKDELFGTTRQDVNLRGYKRHITSQNAPAPLTNAEQELQDIKINEVQTHVSVDSKHQTLQGVAFPISQVAMDKLRELNNGTTSYVQLSVDLENETINLEVCKDTDAKGLQSMVPHDHARYHFFRFKHTHEGDYVESIVFIYSMPGYSCSIKERMLYSSCKAPLIDAVEQHLGMEIARKIEVDEPGELNEQFLYEEVHPKTTIVRQQFARPKGPGGRGPKRMTRIQQSDPQ